VTNPATSSSDVTLGINALPSFVVSPIIIGTLTKFPSVKAAWEGPKMVTSSIRGENHSEYAGVDRLVGGGAIRSNVRILLISVDRLYYGFVRSLHL